MVTFERLSRRNLYAKAVLTILLVAGLAFSLLPRVRDVFNTFSPAPFFDVRKAMSERMPVTFDFVSSHKAADKVMLIEDLLFDEYGSTSFINPDDIFDAWRQMYYKYKYVQSEHYIFRLQPDEVYDIDFQISTVSYYRNKKDAEYVTGKYILCFEDGMAFLVMVPVEHDVKQGDIITGTFIPFHSTLLNGFRTQFSGSNPLENMFPYEFNLTEKFGYERALAVVYTIVLLAIIYLLAVSLIFQVKYKERRYMYKRLLMLNGDEEAIDKELLTAVRKKRSYYTDNWIITPRLFQTNITFNFK